MARSDFCPADFREIWAGVFLPNDWVGLCLDSQDVVVGLRLLAPTSGVIPASARFLVSDQNRSSGQRNLECRLRKWSSFQQTVRNYFETRRFLSIETPTLVPCPGYELHLEPFQTEFRFGREREILYLPTSPEFHLKKALALGFSEIYEMKKVFRNGERSVHHSPEFTLLEWYRSGSTLDQIWQDVRQLFSDCLAQLNGPGRRHPTFEVITFADLFLAHFDYQLSPLLHLGDLIRIAESRGLKIPDGSSADDVFQLLWIEILEPSLDSERVICIRDFPASQAALAQLNDRGFADRFEVYFGGVELANAFQELNDPVTQRLRYNSEIEERRKLGRSSVGHDEEFFAYLEFGLPPAAGIALGLDRMFMVLEGVKDIRDLTLFPYHSRSDVP